MTTPPNAKIHTGDRWYAVQCKPARDLPTAEALAKLLDLTTYAPMVMRKGRVEVKPVPLFPGYIFVRADLQHCALSSIQFAPGVLRVLEFGEGPIALPDRVVEHIRKRIDAINEQGGLAEHNFQPGDTVWLRSGPLRGLQAVFMSEISSKARARILLQFLGRLNEISVDLDALEPAPTSSPTEHRHTRGTRGRGRRIAR